MRVVELSELGELESLQVSSLFAMKQKWKNGGSFTMKQARKQSAFLWFFGAEGLFICPDGRQLAVPKGALVSIPQGATYSLSFLNVSESPCTLLVEFCLFDEESLTLTEGIEIVDSCLRDGQIIDLLCGLCANCSMPNRSFLRIRSDFYRLLFLLSARAESLTLRRRGMQTIEKGIRYLQMDEEQSLSLDEVARMCFVTPAYFRRLFHEYAGMSPMEYRMTRKVEKAKDLLCFSGYTVSEIAALLGFDTPSYFCRTFKKHVGMTPIAYQKQFSVQTDTNSIEK